MLYLLFQNKNGRTLGHISLSDIVQILDPDLRETISFLKFSGSPAQDVKHGHTFKPYLYQQSQAMTEYSKPQSERQKVLKKLLRMWRASKDIKQKADVVISMNPRCKPGTARENRVKH
ncbi:MAG TPA: hypothetical protein VMH27_20435 [Puia sp.]|nr:hypothetical protein [Puia sp.]